MTDGLGRAANAARALEHGTYISRLATTVDLLLPVLDGRWTCIFLKRDEISRKALSFLLLVDHEELLTRCVAILFSSERLVRLLPTALLTVLARAKPVPEFVFAGPSGAVCVSAAAALSTEPLIC